MSKTDVTHCNMVISHSKWSIFSLNKVEKSSKVNATSTQANIKGTYIKLMVMDGFSTICVGFLMSYDCCC